jgi:histidine phosphotransferase ChpT
MSPPPVNAHALAAALAARLLHDLAGPIATIASGVELWSAPGAADLQAEAADLAAAGSGALVEALAFCRAAFGGVGEDRDAGQLASLARTCFAGRRPRLVWGLEPMTLRGAAGPAVLIMAQIAAGALGTGGEARVAAEAGGERLVLRVDGVGPRAILGQEVREGLEGRPSAAGPAGRWAPAAYLNAIVLADGGAVGHRPLADGFRIEATLPRGRRSDAG